MYSVRKFVYHYTSIDSLISIINGNKILCRCVKTAFDDNRDFLVGKYIALALLKIAPERSENDLIEIANELAFSPILILASTSYLFSSTNCYGSYYHWQKYSKDNGCCFQLLAKPLRQHENFMQEGWVHYKNAFKNSLVETFIRSYLDCKIKLSDETVRAFIKDIVFSKYADHENDSEYRFLYVKNVDELEKINKSNVIIEPLPISINPEFDIKNIYFKSESGKLDFLNRIRNEYPKFEGRTKVIR